MLAAQTSKDSLKTSYLDAVQGVVIGWEQSGGLDAESLALALAAAYANYGLELINANIQLNFYGAAFNESNCWAWLGSTANGPPPGDSVSVNGVLIPDSVAVNDGIIDAEVDVDDSGDGGGGGGGGLNCSSQWAEIDFVDDDGNSVGVYWSGGVNACQDLAT
jgi:hypothetical protein